MKKIFIIFFILIFTLDYAVKSINYIKENTTTANLSATLIYQGPTSNAIDGNTGTYLWVQQPGNTGELNFLLNFTSKKNISRMRVYHQDSATVDFQIRANNNCSPIDQFSYSSMNLIIANFSNPTISTWYDVNFSSSANYSCWALIPIASSMSGWLKINEWELYSTNNSGGGNVTNTCTYAGAGNWNIQCSDNCIFSQNSNINGNISITGSGTLQLKANWTFNMTGQYIDIGSGCNLDIFSGSGFN